MNFTVSQDPASGTWNVAPDSMPATGGLRLHLDAALFHGDHLTAGAALCGNNLFSLVAVKNAPFPTCDLTIDGSVIGFSSGIAQGYRQSLLDQFDDFLQQINKLEGQVIYPGGFGLIRSVLAHHIPATFAENLYFHYGYFQGAAARIQTYVDLQAGMRLRIEFDPGAGQPAYHLVEWLRADGTPQLAFDAFFASTELPQVDSNTGGDQSVIDLASALKLRRFLRLCYPPNMPSSDAPASQSAFQRVTLLGADALADLASATGNYYASRPITNSAILVSSFQGRIAAVPEIAMLLNGALLYVTVGTTVRQALTRFTIMPRLAGFRPAFPYRRFAADSQYAGGDIHDSYPEDFYHTVNFQNATLASGLQDAFDLPVLAGDSYGFNIA